jgi:hypothetical protein
VKKKKRRRKAKAKMGFTSFLLFISLSLSLPLSPNLCSLLYNLPLPSLSLSPISLARFLTSPVRSPISPVRSLFPPLLQPSHSSPRVPLFPSPGVIVNELQLLRVSALGVTEVVSPTLPLSLLDIREDDLLYLSIKNDLPGTPAPNVSCAAISPFNLYRSLCLNVPGELLGLKIPNPEGRC